MVISNINSHIVCKDSSGSLTMPKDGSIKCQNIKALGPSSCKNVKPNAIGWSSYGPYLSPAFYYWDAEVSGNWFVARLFNSHSPILPQLCVVSTN